MRSIALLSAAAAAMAMPLNIPTTGVSAFTPSNRYRGTNAKRDARTLHRGPNPHKRPHMIKGRAQVINHRP